MKRSYLILLLLTSFVIYGNAQQRIANIETRLLTSDLVVEGKFLKSTPFWNKSRNMIYTLNEVKVYKLFKGDLQSDKIEVVTEGGEIDDQFVHVTHNIELQKGQEVILFLKTKKVDEKNVWFSYHRPVYELLTPAGFAGKDEVKQYKNIEKEVYLPLQKAANSPYAFLSNSPKQAEFEQWLRDKGIAINGLQGEYGIHYTLDNPQVTGGFQFLEFDIKVATIVNLFEFGNAELFINYDISAFGSNIVGNGNIVANKETVILSTDYSLTLNDETSSKLKIAISADSINNLFGLGTNPEKLCHIKMDISSLVGSANIDFDSWLMQGGSQYYDNGNFVNFPYVWADDSISGSWGTLQTPFIADFYPKTITAGTHSILTIVGSGFGTQAGTVWFRDVDSRDTFAIFPCNDIVSWDTGMIQVYVPSAVNPNLSAGVAGTAGTGYLYLELPNGGGNAFGFGNVLNIPYAITNNRAAGAVQTDSAYRIQLPRKPINPNNNQGGFVVQVSTNLSSFAGVSQSFDESLLRWRCATGINYIRGNDTTLTQQDEDDLISLIYYADSNTLAFDDLGKTYIKGQRQSSCNALNVYGDVYYLREFDIAFNNKWNWYWGTGTIGANQYDFYSTILHELGHAHLIDHTVDSTKCMTPFTDIGESLRTLQFEAIAAGEDVRHFNSFNGLEISICPDSMIWLFPPATICSPFNSIEVSLFEQGSILQSIAPNPFSENFLLTYYQEFNESIKITLQDPTGKIIWEKELNSRAEGSQQIEVNLPLPQGIYILSARTSEKIDYLKLIKQ